MDERNYIQTMLASIGMALTQFYEPMIYWLIFAVVLIITDMRFGVLAARKRGEMIRPSRAVRRTINKMIDYFCWITFAGLCGNTIGKLLGVPIVSMAMFLIVYGIEITSCFNNYFEYRGMNKKINFFKLIGRSDIDEALEKTPEKASGKKGPEKKVEKKTERKDDAEKGNRVNRKQKAD